jgi:hypothetical protein
MIKMLAFLILALSLSVSLSNEALAKKKQPLNGVITCTCACFSDTKSQVKLRRDVTTTVNGDLWQSAAECANLNGGGCRYSNATTGTLSSCQAQ